MKTGPRRSQIRIEYDRKEIAKRYLKGEMQSAIAETLGLTQQQISYDLARIKEVWLHSSLVDFNTIKARELARIDVLEVEYWQAWQASQAQQVRERKEEKRAGSKADSPVMEAKLLRQTQNRDGNPAFLDGVRWCIEQRCKIFGLYEATKLNITWRQEAAEKGIDASDIFERLVSEYAAVLTASD